MLMRTERWLNGPHVLILKEKHADVHYLFSNEEELGIICLEIVRNRFEAGYYTCNGYKKPVLPEGITKESIEKLPPSVQDSAKKVLQHYKWDLKDWEAYHRHAEMAHKACDGNTALARRLLEERSKYEYEGYEVESLIVPKNIIKKRKK